MTDDNDWKWENEEAEKCYYEGGQAVETAFMKLHVYGIQSESNLAEFLSSLQKGIVLLSKAIDIEKAPIPIPYSYLARAYVHFAIHAYGEQADSEKRDKLLRKAIDIGKEAVERYEAKSEWDPGNRHDFHYALAMAHFYREDEMEEAQAELDKARKFRSSNAIFVQMADKLEGHLEKIKEQSGGLKKPTERKSGCLGVISVIVVMLILAILGFFFLYD